MTATARPKTSLRFRGRSFVALVLAPELPVADWLKDLDGLLERSPGFFQDRAVVVDVAAMKGEKDSLLALVAGLNERSIRIMGVEGADPAELGLELPPIGGRQPAGDIVVPDGEKPQTAARPRTPTSLVIETTVRSGQSIIHPD